MQDGSETRTGNDFLGRDGDAADPQARQSLGPGAGCHSAYHRTEHALASVRRQGHAVPDVGLPVAWPDLEVDLADPLGTAREPAVAEPLVARPCAEAPAAAGQAGAGQNPLWRPRTRAPVAG